MFPSVKYSCGLKRCVPICRFFFLSVSLSLSLSFRRLLARICGTASHVCAEVTLSSGSEPRALNPTVLLSLF